MCLSFHRKPFYGTRNAMPRKTCRHRLSQKITPFFVRAPPPGPLRRGVVPLTGYPPSSQGFLSPPWARTWDHELRYPFEVVPTTNWATSSVGSGVAQLVVGTTSNGYLSSWSQVRAHGGERNPCELGG